MNFFKRGKVEEISLSNDIFRKITEQKNKESQENKNFKKKIAILSFKLGSKLQHVPSEEKILLNSGIQLLTQSLILIDNQKPEAVRLFNLAKELL